MQRRRQCMPATTEVWVSDARAQPWFFVTTEANDHLLAAIERDILLDHRCTYATEAADTQRPVPNPQRNKRAKELAALNREQARLEKAYTDAWLATTDASQTHRAALGAQIQDLNERIGEHRSVTKSLPHKVPVGETLDPDTVVRLKPERKIFTDLVRTLAYRAESALLGRVGPLLARDGEEGRAFLKALFATPADLVPNDTELLVRFHSMAPPRLNRALRALCEAANDEPHLYPGTSLRMLFEGPRCLIEN